METKIINLQELANRSADEEQVAKLKKDLKRTKALLKDAQAMIERSRNETSNKVVLRQLKNQLEDTEFARMAAVKAKQNVELEVAEGMGIDTSLLAPIHETGEEFEVQIDVDREDEGDDDMDDEGDYREN